MQKSFFSKVLYFLCFSLLFLSTSTSVLAKDGDGDNNGHIKGTVTTNDNKAAAYVFVQIRQLSKSISTDENGFFRLDNIKPGTYDVEISLTGYENVVKTVTVEPGKTTQLNIQLLLSSKQLDDITVTTSKQKFGIENSNYASKMPLSNIENPQVYTTISKDIIASQMLYSVDDAMRNAPGVQLMWGATGRSGDGGAYYNSRGFIMQSTLRNGIAGIVTDATDAANLETLEVLKGPSGTLFGSTLTSYGGLINRVTKKPYDHFGGSASASLGGYNFGRGSIDLNTPIDNNGKLLFRFNGAYNYQGTFQTEGFSRRYFAAPSLLWKPSDKLSVSLDAELSYGKNQGNPILFFYFPAAELGINNAKQVNMDYKNSYIGDGVTQQSRSQNYFGQINYTIAKGLTSSTNITYGRSFSNGRGPYFFLVPDMEITQNPSDYGKANYLARADQSTTNGVKKVWEIQQNFNADFYIGSLRNRVVLGLDYTRLDANILFYSNASYYDIVPLNQPGFNYKANYNDITLDNYYQKYFDSSNYVSKYPSISVTNTYSAYISDVVNITDRLDVNAAVRVDRFNINDKGFGEKYSQTVFSPKFGAVYQILPSQLSLFANYQNGFTNKNTYQAYRPGQTNSLVTVIAKPEQANQWEAGLKTDLIAGKLSSSLSYYDIKVKNILRADPASPANAQIQDGTQISRGVELQMNATPFAGFSVLAGVSYNNSKYAESDSTIQGLRPTTASSPWQANWWLGYKLPTSNEGSLHFGFGGNYASDNKIMNNRVFNSDGSFKAMNVFTLPSYVVLNASVTLDLPKVSFGVKVDNFTNKHYWTGYTTMNPQMLRQLVASMTYKF